MNLQLGFDALLLPEMADKAENVGVAKAHQGAFQMLSLAVLAGAFIALGAVFSNTAVSGAFAISVGLVKIISGATYSLGLIMVVVGGAELFTGNNLLVMTWANHKVSTGQLLRNWIIVYFGNFVGAILTAIMIYLTEISMQEDGIQGQTALISANDKTGLEFLPAW